MHVTMSRKRPSFHKYVDILGDNSETELKSAGSDISSHSQESTGDEPDDFVKVSPTEFSVQNPLLSPASTTSGSDIPTTATSSLGSALSGCSSLSLGLEINVIEDGCPGNDPHLHNNRLCGYLHKWKVGSRGKQFKKRWFVYSESGCKLRYFRTPMDVEALGEIDIICASFTYQVPTERTTPVFEIRSCGKTYHLEAADEQTRKYWLQELQRKRREHELPLHEPSPAQAEQPSCGGGLVQLDTPPQNHSDSLRSVDSSDGQRLVEPVESPEGTVGWATAKSPGPVSVKDLSFSNWRTELKNKIGVLRRKSRMECDAKTDEGGAVPFAEEAAEADSAELKSRDEAAAGGAGDEDDDRIHRRSLSPRSPKPLALLRQKLAARPKSLHGLGPGSPGAREKGADGHRKVCHRCKQVEEALERERLDSAAIKDELEMNQEVVKVLQKHVDKMQKFVTIDHHIKHTIMTEDDLYSMLHEREDKIVDLEHLLNFNQEKKHALDSQFICLQHQVADLEEQVSMYQESLTAKDHIVIALTSMVADLEGQSQADRGQGDEDSCSGGRCVSAVSAEGMQRVDVQSEDRLKDELTAYKEQNRFLSQEILELNRLREGDLLRERQLKMKVTNLEVQHYTTKSNYLRCMTQLPVQGTDGESQDSVASLLMDAMDTDASRDSKLAASRNTSLLDREKYDRYGFAFLLPGSETDMECQASSLQKRGDQIAYKAKSEEREMSVQVKWENYLLSIGDQPLQRSPELKALVRAGVPLEYRQTVWKACVEFYVKEEKAFRGLTYYSTLLDKVEKSNAFNPVANQVELDLLRTLPTNKHYENMHSDGIPKLRNVLLAFASHNKIVGYCQGLNRLAAIALLILSEEDAFWCLVAIVEYILPHGYYSSGLLGAHCDQRVLKDVVSEKLPRISSHLANMQIDLSLFTFNWFMTIFVDNIPVETVLRIWDTFLLEGSKVLFRFAVAFLKYREDLIMHQDLLNVHQSLRSLGENITDVNRVVQIAFSEINPFRTKYINHRRQLHMQKVKAELAELDSLRRSVHADLPEQERRQTGGGDVSEDDELQES